MQPRQHIRHHRPGRTQSPGRRLARQPVPAPCPACGSGRAPYADGFASRHPEWLADLEDGFVVVGGRLTEYRAPYVDVTVPLGVLSIGRECFADLSVRRVVLPEGTEEIKPRAFAGCRQLREVVLPSSLSEIGDEAFSGCSSLASVSFPGGIRRVGRKAFRGCTSLESVAVTFNCIPVGCFLGCLALSTVSLPETLSSIASDAFCRCSSLAEVTIPNGTDVFSYPGEDVDYATRGAFAKCRSLESVDIDGLTDDIVKSNFQGTPFAGRWQAVKEQIDVMHDTKVRMKDGGGSTGEAVMSAIGTAISSVMEATPLGGDGTVSETQDEEADARTGETTGNVSSK